MTIAAMLGGVQCSINVAVIAKTSDNSGQILESPCYCQDPRLELAKCVIELGPVLLYYIYSYPCHL